MFYEHPHPCGSVRSAAPLTGQKIALAVALSNALALDAASPSRRGFLVDILKQAPEGPCALFPDGGTRIAREMRVLRLLAEPVEVPTAAGPVVLTFHNEPKKRMYQKTKAVVATRGTLESLGHRPRDVPTRVTTFDPAAAWTPYDGHVKSWGSAPAFTTSPPAPAQVPPVVLAQLEERLAALELTIAENGVSQGLADEMSGIYTRLLTIEARVRHLPLVKSPEKLMNLTVPNVDLSVLDGD